MHAVGYVTMKVKFPSNHNTGNSTNRDWTQKKYNSRYCWLYMQPSTT